MSANSLHIKNVDWIKFDCSLSYLCGWFVCLFTACVRSDWPSQMKIIEAQLFETPDRLCFARPCLLAYFRETTSLHCAREARPFPLGKLGVFSWSGKCLLPGNG